MKKLYVELIELYCRHNSNNRVWLEDAIYNIQQDLKDYHNFAFTDALTIY